jgi:hypothetical protein
MVPQRQIRRAAGGVGDRHGMLAQPPIGAGRVAHQSGLLGIEQPLDQQISVPVELGHLRGRKRLVAHTANFHADNGQSPKRGPF